MNTGEKLESITVIKILAFFFSPLNKYFQVKYAVTQIVITDRTIIGINEKSGNLVKIKINQ